MATPFVIALRAFRDQAMALVGQIPDSGSVDKFPGAVGEMRARPPDPELQSLVRAIVPAIRAADDYIQRHQSD